GDAKRIACEQSLHDGSNTYHVAKRRFVAIPGSPWVYWVSESVRALFEQLPALENVAEPKVGTQTADNTLFLRFWWEVGCSNIGFGCGSWSKARQTTRRWFPYMKGGRYRKWYGNQEFVVNWHA